MIRRSIATCALALTIVAPVAGTAEADSFESMRLERMTAKPADAPAPPRHAARPSRAPRVVTTSVEAPAASDGGGAWQVHAGQSLEATLADWCRRSGWSLQWKSEFSYELTSDVTLNGRFEQAVDALVTGMRDVRPTPTVTFFNLNRQVLVTNDGAGLTD